MKRRLAAIVATGVVVISLGVFWIFGTESGLRWAWARVQAWTGIALSAESLQGTLAGPLTARQLAIRVGGTRFTAANITVDWQPSALLTGTLAFRQLVGSDVRFQLPVPAPEEDGEPFTGFTLPLSLDLDHVRVEDLKVLEGEEVLYVLNSGELSGQLEQTEVELAHLELQGPWGRFRAAGRFGTVPAAAIDLETHWRLTLPELPQPVAGIGRITGSFAKPQFHQQITEPAAATAEGRLDWQAQPFSWRVRLKSAGVSLNQIESGWRPLRIAGEISADGKASAFSASGDLTLVDPAMGRWSVNTRLQADERWELEQLQLIQADGPAEVEASGVWIPAFDNPGLIRDGQLMLQWQNLSWPPKGPQPLMISPEGNLTVTGDLSAYALKGTAALRRPEEPSATLHLAATGDRDQLRAESLELAWLDGRAAGNARLQWSDGIAWSAELRGSGFDPARLVPDWPGAIGFNVAGHGSIPREGEPATQIALKNLSGTLRGQPLGGAAEAQLTGTRLALDRLNFSVGAASLGASGTIGATWDMAWQLEAPQLGIIPDLKGNIRAEGRLNGPRQAPRIRLQATGSDVAAGEIGAGTIALRADLDLAGKTAWDARFEVTGLEAPQAPPIDRVTVSAEGSASDHRIRLEALGSGIRLLQTARGGYVPGRWRGRLTDGIIRGLPPDTWRQASPAVVSVDTAGVELDRFCWRSGNSRACASVSETTGQLELAEFPLATVSPFIAVSGIRLDGSINANIDADLASGHLDAEVAAAGAGISYGEGATDLSLAFETVRLIAQSRPEGTSAELDLVLVRGGRLHAAVRSPHAFPFGTEAPIDGSIELDANRLGWVSLLVPEVAEPKGQIVGSFQVSGTVANPDFQGGILLEGGDAFIVPAGIRIRPIRLQLQAGGGNQLLLSGEARSGPGRIELDARIQQNEGRWQVSGTVSGEDFEAVRLPQTKVFLSPQLQLDISPGRVTVTGRLHVPRADIELRELPEGVERSPDVVVVRDEEIIETRAGWETRADVTVTFGDQIKLSGFGLSGRLTGRLAISERPGQVATGTGELRILEGRYEAYGQELTISEGRLLFAETPITNPAVDLRAIRVVDDVTAGIEVTGELKQPEVRLFSEPPMEESDALAFLIVGRPLNQASRSEGNLLYNAALSLGFRGGNFLADQISNQFGIEEIELERDPQSETASLVLGTHLSPRLYLQYVVAFAETVNRVRIRYELGTHWTLEAESGEQTGTDLFYTIER